MRKLSLTEFKKFYDEFKITEVSYNTDNQRWYNKFKELSIMDIRFDEMGISLNPNVVYFKKGKSVMRLNDVECIFIEEDSPCFIFTIVCSLSDDNSGLKKFVFLAN